MTTPASPFTELAHRMVRAHDTTFESLLSNDRAIVRLLGPRRIGKTDLVSHYARERGTPMLCVTIKPIPPDLPPAEVIAALLANEIQALTQTAPKLAAKYEKIERSQTRAEARKEFGGGVKFPVAKVTIKTERISKLSAESRADPDVEIARSLRRLELAADALGIRPIVFFDEIQELLLKNGDGPGMATIWAIRNEVQHHTACRYVFAGSNQRQFSKLHVGRGAPFLNLGAALEIPPVTLPELDAWAVPLFRAGGRHVRTLGTAEVLLCGKIGEIVEVCTWLWTNSKPGDLLDDAIQKQAVTSVARLQPGIDQLVRQLTAPQAHVLRWIVFHPKISPFTIAATAVMKLNPGTVNSALKALLDAELIECFGPNEFVATTPLKLLAALSPELWSNSDDAG